MSSAEPMMNISDGDFGSCSLVQHTCSSLVLNDSVVASADISLPTGVCLPAQALLRAEVTFSDESLTLRAGDALSVSESLTYHIVVLGRSDFLSVALSAEPGKSTGIDLSDGAGLHEYGIWSEKPRLEVSLPVSSWSPGTTGFPKKTVS